MGEFINILDLEYNTILDAYNNFFNSALISKILIGFKVIAIGLFLLSIYSNMISKIGSRWSIDSDVVTLPYTPSKMITSLIFVLLIAFYDKFLIFLDNILISIDGEFNQIESLGVTFVEEEIVEEVPTGWQAALVAMSQAFELLFTMGSVLILKLLNGLASAIDAMIYAVFLVQRFFMLGLIKLLGPFAIAIAIFKGGNDMFMKWLKHYLAAYLLIIPYFLVIGFTNEIATVIRDSVTDLVGSVIEVFVLTALETTIIIFMIWIKLKLFKKSYEIVYKVIT